MSRSGFTPLDELDVDVDARSATVEPGLVLDHLNAQLKPHGLWYPVDVSTSAQATLGGMAGNNSCGSRSIAYGNMVHNVLGASAWLSDGSLLEYCPLSVSSLLLLLLLLPPLLTFTSAVAGFRLMSSRATPSIFV